MGDINLKAALGGQVTLTPTDTASNYTATFPAVTGVVSVQASASYTTGSVLFVNSSGQIAQNNSQLFWDNTNNYLGIGTASPSSYGKLVTYSSSGNNTITAVNAGTTVSDLSKFLATANTYNLENTCYGNGLAYTFTNVATAYNIGTSSSAPVVFFTNNTERSRIDSSGNFYFNSGYGSSALAYGCRAWANFDGTGSTSANATIRGSANISSIFKNGTGTFTVNFTNAMPDTNYSVSGFGRVYSTQTANGWVVAFSTNNSTTGLIATGSFRIGTYGQNGVEADSPIACIQVYR